MKLRKETTVQKAASILGVEIKGDKNQKISGLNEIHKVEDGDVTFVDIEKYYRKAINSPASIIIINSKEIDPPPGKSFLLSDDPFRDYNKLVSYFSPKPKIPKGNYRIGSKSKVHRTSKIYPGVFIGNRVSIGKNCIIYPNVAIYDDSTIGNNVVIHANTVIGADAFYFKNRKTHFEKLISCGEVIIEDDVEIGAACTIDKGVSGKTIIGKHTKIDNQVQIGHGVVVGKRCLIAAQVGIGGKTIIEDDVIIWGQAGITKDITIGSKAVISAQAGVSKSLKGGKLYFGSPAQEAEKAYREMALLRILGMGKSKK
jgi:UDP-3-O-[3-hydroxymyristoyl] glucosamine N-acyltransferase